MGRPGCSFLAPRHPFLLLGSAGSGLVPQRGLQSATAESQVGNGEKGVQAPRAPSQGFCVLQPPTLSSPSPAGLFLSVCSTRAGGQGARLRSLLLSVGPKQPSLASICHNSL